MSNLTIRYVETQQNNTNVSSNQIQLYFNFLNVLVQQQHVGILIQ